MGGQLCHDLERLMSAVRARCQRDALAKSSDMSTVHTSPMLSVCEPEYGA